MTNLNVRTLIYQWQQKINPYLFLLPNSVLFVIFVVIPCLFGVYYSLTSYDGLNPPEFIGLENYKYLLTNDYFYEVLGRTFIYVFSFVPLLFMCSLALAMLLAQKIKGKGFFRAVIYWPTMISYIVVGVAWKWILGDNFGIANYLLGDSALPWLSDGLYAFIAVIIVSLWAKIGFFMVIFIGGIQSIPEHYYEAARIDGANSRQLFIKITLPLLKPTSILVVILATIEAFKMYGLLYALTSGGPGDSTTYIVQYIRDTGFARQDFGMASAMSVLLFLILGFLTLIQLKLSRDRGSDEE